MNSVTPSSCLGKIHEHSGPKYTAASSFTQRFERRTIRQRQSKVTQATLLESRQKPLRKSNHPNHLPQAFDKTRRAVRAAFQGQHQSGIPVVHSRAPNPSSLPCDDPKNAKVQSLKFYCFEKEGLRLGLPNNHECRLRQALLHIYSSLSRRAGRKVVRMAGTPKRI